MHNISHTLHLSVEAVVWKNPESYLIVNLGEKLERQEATGTPGRNGNTDSKQWGHPSPSVMRKHSEDAVKGCSSAQGRAGTPVAGRSVQHGAPVKDSTGHHRTFCSYADNFLATKPWQLLGLWEWPSCCYLTTFVKSAYKILMKGQIWLDKELTKSKTQVPSRERNFVGEAGLAAGSSLLLSRLPGTLQVL